jgi:bla regulator protein BlaR1
MPNGKEYWVISWTKGTVFINGTGCPYELEDDKMYLNIVDPNDNSFYKIAVYENVDNKKYIIDEIVKKDNINVPFMEDSRLKGCWQSVDFVNNPSCFNPSKKYWKDTLYLEKIIVSSANDCIAIYNGEKSNARRIKYTKDYIINLCLDNTLSNYKYLTMNNSNYIIVEWKSGDYIYGKMINGYYVLKRID